MATALVTGLAGQDGGYLAEQLVAAGHVVHGVVSPAHDPAGVPEHLRALGDSLVVHEADLRDLPALTALVDEVSPDRLFNLAGMSSVAASWEDPVGALEVNARPVLGLLEHLFQRTERGAAPTRFVQASSAEVFAGSGRTPIDEACPVSAVNPYGAAKAFAHQAVGMYRQRGLHASSLVLFNHESPRRPHRFVTRKITAGVAAIAAGRADRLTLGNLAVHRDWGWAPDYTRAMVLAADAETPDDYVVATGESHSLFDLVETAFAQVGIADWRPYVVSDAALVRPADAEVLVGDSTRLRTRLGWAPTVDFAGMVAAMVAADVAEPAADQPA
ncbi:GDP-mannose 4,6-dehydratase [Blastococcus sp. TML/M2B]|uniref:GDP-mannose 4,6-dehydratase n=1 Tax=unclassified Blastococcus TaxID=2619396 RepID=UPI0019092E93|nr:MULTISPECIES: GDP-mannose 4,6-dehydratase [unclassified Blastococcus]MBN1093816.1 GDP-mannose 4,6-dehydratase [Blastococcus sp. TML/M2B]MBN1096061.1 GDP-mannose 4,6-dehydratase [Blastococcus sp. TML/C7B]